MPVIVALVVLAVLVVGGITGALVWVASSRPGALDGQTLSEPTRSAAHEPLPAAVTPAAVDALRFDQAARGYRMSQVDAVLDRVRDELSLRDEEIARLRTELDIARTGLGDPELGHGPVIRPGSEQSLWAPEVRSYQVGEQAPAQPSSTPAAEAGVSPRDDV